MEEVKQGKRVNIYRYMCKRVFREKGGWGEKYKSAGISSAEIR